MKRYMHLSIAVVLLLGIAGSACAPEKVVETVEVEVAVEVTKIVTEVEQVEVVVTPTPLPAKPCPD
jgi:hypothetical protein